jgi:hypothetical protein
MMPLQGMFLRWQTLGVPEKDVVVGCAPKWALDLEPLAKTPVSDMMPLKKGDVPMVAKPRRPLEGCCEGGGRCSTEGAGFGAPGQGSSIGYDAPEERGCYGGEP